MCGIAGVFGSPGAEAITAKMLAAQRHRGPDAIGHQNVSEGALGAVRLRIQDLSPMADMPMLSRDKSLSLVFNGEIYNHKALRHRFLPDVQFETGSDTETLLHLLGRSRREPEKVLPELDGMFAFALWDEDSRSLFLARDRLGVKPLYFSLTSSSLAFSSEARALVGTAAVTGALSARGITQFLTWGSVVGAQSILDGVTELPPAHWLKYNSGESTLKRWWRPNFEARSRSDLEAIALLSSAFTDSVNEQTVGDRQLGVFLSGGVDSRAIAAVAARRSSLRAITLTFPEDAPLDEGKEAQAFAAELGIEHIAVPVETSRATEAIKSAFGSLDQPTYDGFNSQLLSEATSEAGIVVALSGLGGDELFGGYNIEKFALRNRRLSYGMLPCPGSLRTWAADSISARSPGSGLARLADARSGPEIYTGTRGVFDRPFVSRLFAQSDWEAPKWPAAAKFADNITLLEWSTYLPSQLLRDTDTASMRYSVEVRVPILSNRLVDAALTVPTAQRLRVGKRALMSAGRLSTQQQKRGFILPYERWFKGPLRGLLQDGLLSDELPLTKELDRTVRKRLFDGYVEGRVHWMRPWLVASLRLWADANGFRTVH